MRRTWCLVALAAAALPPNPATGQPLVPLDDPVQEPLLPTAISSQDIDLSAALAYLWQQPDGTHVVHLIGDFELSKGQQRMTAREAVIWMTVQTHEDVRYQHLEVFLWQDVEIIEPAGTTTQAPLMMITLNTRGRVQTHAGRVAHESSSDTAVYQEALRVRRRLAEAASATGRAEPTDRFIGTTIAESSPRRSVYFRAPRQTTIGEIDGQPVITLTGGITPDRETPENKVQTSALTCLQMHRITEEEGFEPPVRFPVQRFSRPSPKTRNPLNRKHLRIRPNPTGRPTGGKPCRITPNWRMC